MNDTRKRRQRGIFPVRSVTDLILKLLITMQLLMANVGIFYVVVIQAGLFPWVVPQTIVLGLLMMVFTTFGLVIVWLIWLKPGEVRESG